MDLTKALFRGDRVIWAIFFILCTFSLVEVYSASSMLSYKATARHFDPIMRHATFLLGGTLLVIVIQNINYKKFSTLGFYILIFAFILLIYALAGGMKVNDAQRWVSFGGVSFQPSEFAKLGVIISTSYILARFQDEDHASKNAFKWVMSIAGFFCLLIVKENFSTAFLLFAVVYILMFIGRVQFRKLFVIAAVGIGFILMAIYVIPNMHIKALEKTRYTTWINRLKEHDNKKEAKLEDLKITDKNRQVMTGKIAIANGGSSVFGMLPGNSQTRDFLPQAFSDFIYAIILEETGFLGGFFVLFLYFVLLFRVGIIARRCNHAFPALLIIGSALLIVFQAIINMSVAVNLIPVTGQPLPLISRGGTSTILTCIYFGIILSVSQYANACENTRKMIAAGEMTLEEAESEEVEEQEENY